MLELLLVSVFAAAVTVAEGGVVFQPAMSPDGTKVAFAADEEGFITIYVAPAAGGGARTRIVQVGAGADAQRLAVHALIHRPWSDDSKRLIYMVPSPTADQRMGEALYAVNADGTEPKMIGPPDGVVENASWLKGNDVIFTHREGRQDPLSELSESEKLYVVDASKGWDPETAGERDLFKESLAADLAPSPDGKWVATLHLSGARDARKRQVRILDLVGGRTFLLENTDRANFLTWALDGKGLYYVNVTTHDVSLWVPEEASTRDAKMDDVAAMIAIEGALLTMDTRGVVTARSLETGKRGKDLTRDYVPISFAAGRAAFVRRGSLGAAIVVADVGKAAVEAGDIGLPKPPPAAGTPEHPPEKPAQPPKPPVNGGENGSIRPVPAGTVVPGSNPPG